MFSTFTGNVNEKVDRDQCVSELVKEISDQFNSQKYKILNDVENKWIENTKQRLNALKIEYT